MALMEELGRSDEQTEAYLTLARYADNQYRRIERHMQSTTFEAKKQLLQKSKVKIINLIGALLTSSVMIVCRWNCTSWSLTCQFKIDKEIGTFDVANYRLVWLSAAVYKQDD